MNLAELKQKAKAGNPQAQYELGMRYMTGDEEIKKNRGHGLRYLEKAAEQKHKEALRFLVTIYADKRRSHYAPEKALQYYNKLKVLGEEVDDGILDRLEKRARDYALHPKETVAKNKKKTKQEIIEENDNAMLRAGWVIVGAIIVFILSITLLFICHSWLIRIPLIILTVISIIISIIAFIFACCAAVSYPDQP